MKRIINGLITAFLVLCSSVLALSLVLAFFLAYIAVYGVILGTLGYVAYSVFMWLV